MEETNNFYKNRSFMKEKIVFIPGWMDIVENLVNWSGIDIWKKKFDVKKKIDADYIVGYSAGANWALLNWQHNKNTKLILVMPLIPERKVMSWFIRWIKHEIFEGSEISKKRIKCFPHIFLGVFKLISLMKVDLISILDEINKEDVIFIRGKKDYYFFDEETAKILEEKGFRLIELDDVGHNWNKRIILEISKIVNV
jgi:hypothetical protein